MGAQLNQNDTLLSILLNTAFRYNILIQFQQVNSVMAGHHQDSTQVIRSRFHNMLNQCRSHCSVSTQTHNPITSWLML